MMQRSQASQNWRQRDPNPPPVPVAKATNNANRLYVGNLPYQAGKEEISALFASNNFVVYVTLRRCTYTSITLT